MWSGDVRSNPEPSTPCVIFCAWYRSKNVFFVMWWFVHFLPTRVTVKSITEPFYPGQSHGGSTTYPGNGGHMAWKHAGTMKPTCSRRTPHRQWADLWIEPRTLECDEAQTDNLNKQCLPQAFLEPSLNNSNNKNKKHLSTEEVSPDGQTFTWIP